MIAVRHSNMIAVRHSNMIALTYHDKVIDFFMPLEELTLSFQSYNFEV